MYLWPHSATVKDIHGYAAELQDGDGSIVHAMAFRCFLDSAALPSGAAAVVIPVPAVPGSFAGDGLVPDAPETLLDEIVSSALAAPRGRVGIRVIELPTRSARSAIMPSSRLAAALRIRDVPKAIKAMGLPRPPRIPAADIAAMASAYPGWAAVVWCFLGPCRAITPSLIVGYRPRHEDRLFFPGPPVRGDYDRKQVRLAVGSPFLVEGIRPRLPHTLSDAARQLADVPVIGDELSVIGGEGDILCSVQDVRAGVFAPRILPPPGAERHNKAP
jgi:hypothetical protein